jgi:DNA repair exonuclease SbcCD ATPase subunit
VTPSEIRAEIRQLTRQLKALRRKLPKAPSKAFKGRTRAEDRKAKRETYREETARIRKGGDELLTACRHDAVYPRGAIPTDVAAAVLDLAKSAEAAEDSLSTTLKQAEYESNRAEAAEAKLAEAAAIMGVPDGGRYINDWKQHAESMTRRLAEVEREREGEQTLDAAIRPDDARQLEKAQSALAAAEAREKALLDRIVTLERGERRDEAEAKALREALLTCRMELRCHERDDCGNVSYSVREAIAEATAALAVPPAQGTRAPEEP